MRNSIILAITLFLSGSALFGTDRPPLAQLSSNNDDHQPIPKGKYWYAIPPVADDALQEVLRAHPDTAAYFKKVLNWIYKRYPATFSETESKAPILLKSLLELYKNLHTVNPSKTNPKEIRIIGLLIERLLKWIYLESWFETPYETWFEVPCEQDDELLTQEGKLLNLFIYFRNTYMPLQDENVFQRFKKLVL